MGTITTTDTVRAFVRLALLTLGLAALAACGGAPAAPIPTPPPSTPPARDYWPSDGWRAADPTAVGLDPELAATLDAAVARDLPFLKSLLVVKNGYLAYEQYFNGATAADLHTVNSITKSVVSAVYGTALADGMIPSVDVTLGEAMPAVFSGGAYRDYAGITLRDLLQMRSGLAWDEGRLEEEASAAALDGGPEAAMAVIRQRATAAAILSSDIAYAPGEAWSYSSADTNLASAAFSALAGQSVADYAAERLFPALGVTEWEWLAAEDGVTVGGIGLQLAPRDIAKFGYLFLNRGLWDGQPVIPADWVRAGTWPQPEGVFTGNGQTMPIDWYGMQWWNWRPEFFAGQRAIAGQGYAGQALILLPDLDMIVVTTADTFVAPDAAERQMSLVYELVKTGIIPAVTDPPSSDPFWALPAREPQHDAALYAVGADGRDQTLLYDDPQLTLWGPAVSPDGQQIAFGGSRGCAVCPGHQTSELFVADRDGGNVHQLTDNGRSNYLPAWSPDGTRIVYVSGHVGFDSHEIRIINADGTGDTSLTDNDVQEYGVAWSPDGATLAFGSKQGGDELSIYTMNPDGSQQQPLATAAAGHSPSWSPDGRRIVFTSERDGQADIWVMDADGGNQRPLITGEGWDYLPAWSPDGSQIAFTSTRDGDAAIFVAAAGGGELTRVSGRDVIADVAAWLPDSTGLIFHGLATPRRGLLERFGP